MTILTWIRSVRFSLIPQSHGKRLALIAILSLLAGPSQAWWANIAATPNPNTGDYTVTWDSNPSLLMHLQENIGGTGSWTTIASNYSGTHSITGQLPGNYMYRVLYTSRYCYWVNGIRKCTTTYNYSESTTVTVNGPSGGEDPYDPPDPFSPPSAANFPDAAIVNPSAPISDEGVGALNASGGVSGGQASYSIPIVVPPGRKGMQPSVSLSYSSSSGNGVAGVGWGLSATSSISRCSATPAQPDGQEEAFYGVQYDSARDRLCLNGQRLVVEDGYTYGASGARYRVELDIFARVTQTGALNSSSTYFTVEFKNGRTSRYGYDANAKRDPAGATKILEWFVDETQDPSGNTITFDYQEHGSGEVLVDKIHYTGFNGSNGDRHVEFDYELREDVRSSYLAGGLSRSTQRLKTITTLYGTTKVREYTLDYGTSYSAATGRSLLRGIQECAFEGATPNCLPPTTFEWQEAAAQFEHEELEFFDPDNLDPDPDPPYEDARWLHDVMPQGDADGDGVKDWPGYYVNAEGEITELRTETLANCFRAFNSMYLKCIQGDFNSDGLTDNFRQNNNKFEIAFADPDNSSPSWFSTGIDWDSSGASSGLDDVPFGFGDFNGDGWLDVVFMHARVVRIYYHTKNLSAPYSTAPTYYQDVVTLTANASNGRGQEAQIYGDMDGNGTPDFVLSRYQGADEAPGLPEPQSIILTIPQSGGAMTTSTRTISAAGLFIEEDSNSHFFHDVNGDGLSDLLGVDPDQNWTVKYRLNTGLDFAATWVDLNFSLPMREGSYFHSVSGWVNYQMPIMSKILTIDYNGDGRDDLLYAGSGADILVSACADVASAGGGTQNLCNDDLYGEYQSSQMTHVGSPINGAIVDNSVRRYKVVEFYEDANGLIKKKPIYTSGIEASASQTAVVDATGDGLPDVVTVYGCRTSQGCQYYGTGDYDPGAHINRNTGSESDDPNVAGWEYAPSDMMSAAEDGLGNRHEWTYRPLSSDAPDTASSQYYHKDHSYESNDSDYFHFASSMYVVAYHRASNGIGGLSSTKYRYRGAIYNNKGRGFQGFRVIEVEEDVFDDNGQDAHLDKISRTEFHQKWPLSSIVDQSCSWLAVDTIVDVTPANHDPNATCDDVTDPYNDKQLSWVETDEIHNVATKGGARFVAVKKQTSKSYDLASRDKLVTKVFEKGFDVWGNVETETLTHIDDWTSNQTDIERDFFPIESWWWLNKLTSETTTYHPVSQRHANTPTVSVGQDSTKTFTTDYLFYDNAHRLPTTTEVSGSGSSNVLTTDAIYNAYGLPTTVTITGTDVTGPRDVTTTYSKNGISQSTDGYFPFTVENALGHISTQHTDPKHGVPIDSWDPNGLHSSVTPDAFGRPEATAGPGQPTVYTGWNWCGGAVWCNTGAVYRVTTVTAGAPLSYSYHDQFGRVVYTMTRNYADSDWVRTVTTFDERGNTTFQSVPHDLTLGELATKGVHYLAHDAFNRLTSKAVDQAASQVMQTSYAYSGYTTNIDAESILMSRTYDGFGRLVETVDGKGGFTRYAYDGAGNPIVIADPEMINNASIVGIKAAYNALGHKLWVEDPNWYDEATATHLSKTFTYNAIGEVLSELDPNGDLVEMNYDALGRLTDRLVNGNLNGKWHYDSTDTYGGLGLPWLEDSQFRDDGSRLQKFFYYSDAVTGRKDLLQVKHRFFEDFDPNEPDEYDTAYFTDSFYARPKGMQFPGGASLAYGYDNHGHVTEEKDPVSGTIYRQTTSRDSRFQTRIANIGNHSSSYLYQETRDYFWETGQVDYITVSNGSSTLQSLTHEYDVFGNLDWRTTTVGTGANEALYYDELQRLTTSVRNYNSGGDDTVNYTFDASGTFITKSDYDAVPDPDISATYVKHAYRPHVVTQLNLSSGGPVVYSHDKNGNVTLSDGETISYNAFNKPKLIEAVVGNDSAEFTYGADLMRYRQEGESGAVTYYIDKHMEVEESLGGTKDYRHYLGDVAILTKTGDLNDPSPSIDYVFRDRLGSVSAIGSSAASFLTEFRAYDPYGRPRNGDWTDKIPEPIIGSSATDRGFTDHEHLDDWQLIHMNGRGFDYNAGRFLSVDPIIQDPGNSQSINGFAYIMNNPFSGTDPSGYSPLCLGVAGVVGCGGLGGISQYQINASFFQPTGLQAAQLQLLGSVLVPSVDENFFGTIYNGRVIVEDPPFSSTGEGTEHDEKEATDERERLKPGTCAGGWASSACRFGQALDFLATPWGGTDGFNSGVKCLWQCGWPGRGWEASIPGVLGPAGAELSAAMSGTTGALTAARSALAGAAPWQIEAAYGSTVYKKGGLMTTMEHIMYRHSYNAAAQNVSRFSAGTTEAQISGYIDSALRFGTVTRSGSAGYSVVYNLGAPIGTNISGSVTSTIQVFVNSGIIKTAYPL